MQADVSLWPADLLDVGRAVDLVADLADGFACTWLRALTSQV